MGVVTVVTALLIADGFLDSKAFVVPIVVIFAAGTVIVLGLFFDGWKIEKTMTFRLASLKPYQDFVQKLEAASY